MFYRSPSFSFCSFPFLTKPIKLGWTLFSVIFEWNTQSKSDQKCDSKILYRLSLCFRISHIDVELTFAICSHTPLVIHESVFISFYFLDEDEKIECDLSDEGVVDASVKLTTRHFRTFWSSDESNFYTVSSLSSLCFTFWWSFACLKIHDPCLCFNGNLGVFFFLIPLKMCSKIILS